LAWLKMPMMPQARALRASRRHHGAVVAAGVVGAVLR
jgi:hypothetical protein